MVHSAADEQRSSKKTTEKPRVLGRPWPRGTSGNPAGRRRGSKNKRTILLEKLLHAPIEDLMGIETALFKAIPGVFPGLLPKRKRLSLRHGYLALAFLRTTTGALCVTARLHAQQSDADTQ